jgi:hypothetical protein
LSHEKVLERYTQDLLILDKRYTQDLLLLCYKCIIYYIYYRIYYNQLCGLINRTTTEDFVIHLYCQIERMLASNHVSFLIPAASY